MYRPLWDVSHDHSSHMKVGMGIGRTTDRATADGMHGRARGWESLEEQGFTELNSIHTHAYTLTHAYSLTHAYTHTLTHAYALTHTYALTHAYSLTHAYTHILTHAYALTHTRTHTHIHTHTRLRTHTHIRTHTRIRTHTQIHAHRCICTEAFKSYYSRYNLYLHTGILKQWVAIHTVIQSPQYSDWFKQRHL